MNCKNCRANCTGAKKDREIALCLGYDPPKTNADRVRAMSDEELAEILESECPPKRHCPNLEEEMFDKSYHEMCKKCWIDWLRQEVET